MNGKEEQGIQQCHNDWEQEEMKVHWDWELVPIANNDYLYVTI